MERTTTACFKPSHYPFPPTDHAGASCRTSWSAPASRRAGPRRQDRYWLGADLVAEVVSPDDAGRGLVEKRADYAEGNIPEYWIVDPRDETITVLALEGDAYVEHGLFARGAPATSARLEGFEADVSEVFDAPESGA